MAACNGEEFLRRANGSSSGIEVSFPDPALSGVKQTLCFAPHISAFDPKRTSRHRSTRATAAHRMSYCGATHGNAHIVGGLFLSERSVNQPSCSGCFRIFDFDPGSRRTGVV